MKHTEFFFFINIFVILTLKMIYKSQSLYIKIKLCFSVIEKTIFMSVLEIVCTYLSFYL